MIARAAAVSVAAVGAAHLVPSVATIPWLHRRFAPALSGVTPGSHVALTFDDGPDPASTPQFLAALDDLDVRATFFLLGARVREHPDLARRIADAGHEVAVHGWVHTPHLLRTPWGVYADLHRTRGAIRAATGLEARYWRPPNGIVTGAGLAAARLLALRPVLWTADGRDWQARATPATVTARVQAQLRPGGTVLLHDSDITSAPRSWTAALGALPEIVQRCRSLGWPVGPLGEHWPAPTQRR